jgi:hypothetical protein
MAPPSESRTTPLTAPAVCALTVAGTNPATSAATNTNPLRNIESPLADSKSGTPKPRECDKHLLKVN